MPFKLLLFICFFSFSNLSYAQTINTEKSEVSFKISNLGFSQVEGTFSGMNGTLQFDVTDLSNASFNVCIDPSSVDTGIESRDGHLLKEDYFNTEKHPTICFVSSSISKTNKGYKAKGQLTMKDVTKEITLPFTFNNNEFTGNITINRLDFNIGPNGSFMMGKTTDLEIRCVVD